MIERVKEREGKKIVKTRKETGEANKKRSEWLGAQMRMSVGGETGRGKDIMQRRE